MESKHDSFTSTKVRDRGMCVVCSPYEPNHVLTFHLVPLSSFFVELRNGTFAFNSIMRVHVFFSIPYIIGNRTHYDDFMSTFWCEGLFQMMSTANMQIQT